MASREEIAETIRTQFAHVKERGRILARAFKARAEIAAARRRLRMAFADLGEEVYGRMLAGEWKGDARLETYRARIEGVKAELKQREEALKEIVEGKRKTEEAGEPPREPAGEE